MKIAPTMSAPIVVRTAGDCQAGFVAPETRDRPATDGRAVSRRPRRSAARRSLRDWGGGGVERDRVGSSEWGRVVAARAGTRPPS
jgi:hypothetical protein